MSCSPFDLKDYFLKELLPAQRGQVEAHFKTCDACREELEKLRLTEAALCTLREEEIPQRIAFVSDKIFEPSPWRRAWAGFWGSSGRLAFAGAAMLSAAILFSAVTRPAPVITGSAPPAAAAIAPVSRPDIQQQIQAAVEKAVAESQTRQTAEIQQKLAQLESTRQHLLLAAAELDQVQRRANVERVAFNGYGPPTESGKGGVK